VAPTATASDRASREQRVARGLEVCRREYCGTCHTLDAADTAGLFGPTHNGIGSTAERRIREPGYMGTATTVEAYIRESIVSPGVYVVEGYGLSRYRMPAYSHLDQEDLNALVQMLLQQKR
jgi:nitric oxide reductase subunit C